ncbi:sterigmatocystin 8-O-methyltransferase [Xylaria scruposa]|nr:sterigmatocystin 8-O-methyltransferase [Xylaria scruposa]
MSSKEGPPRFVQLAQMISSSATQLQEILIAHNAPFPSFDKDGDFQLPKEASNLQDMLIDAAAELHDLLLDSISLLHIHGAYTNMICFQAIARFGIASMIPENGQASYEDIAQQTCLTEPVLRRILQVAMTMRIFYEPQPGMVAHTKASRLLSDPHMNDWLGSQTEEAWPSALNTINALEKWPKSQEPNESGFSLANRTNASIYNVLTSDSIRAQRFANFMKISASSYDYDAVHVIDNYDWGSLGTATVVDVGGSQGHIGIQLAKKFSDLRIVVQDVESVVDGAYGKVPEDLKGRVRFEAHDFFQPQVIVADVFFLRLILHNWTDKSTLTLAWGPMGSLGPVGFGLWVQMANPRARVIIMDACMKERGILPLWREKIVRKVDMMMGAFLNARERTYGEWKSLLADADPRFVLTEVIEPQDSSLALIDVRWNDHEV